ncbi:hypothetical protein BH11CYA1_BH11CYA1_12500 [soil metagenome]
MGKSYRGRNKATIHCHGSDVEAIFVALSDIYVSEATWAKLIARDGQQIEQYRQAYENGEEMVRVVLRPRFDGGYNVEDGRHRVIAAKQAGVGFIEAAIVGAVGSDEFADSDFAD